MVELKLTIIASKLIKLLSQTVEKEFRIFSKPLVRVVQFQLQMWQRRKKCVLVLALILVKQNGFNVYLTYSGWAFSWLLMDPTIIKLGTVTPYIKKI